MLLSSRVLNYLHRRDENFHAAAVTPYLRYLFSNMSKAIDYSKWNLIEDDDYFEENGASDNPTVMFHKFDELKLNADKLFAAAELSRDLYDYKVALNQGYLICLDELKHNSRREGIAGEGIAHTEVSCKLNCACCHLRLMEFQRTIDVCTSVFADYQKIMTQDQMIRLRYFRGYSYCKIDLDENLLLAETDAAEMQKILVSLETIHGPSVAEYRDFFQTLHEKRQKLLFFDDLIRAESEYFESHMGNSVQSKKGWVFYVQKKFTLSSEWFACKLSDLRKESVDNSRDKDLLCDHYCGYGKSQLALNNYIEASNLLLGCNMMKFCEADKLELIMF